MTEPKHRCDKCNYNTNRKSSYDMHLKSKKHRGIVKNKYKEHFNKDGYYECESCKFCSAELSNFKVHLKTDKHFNLGADDRNVRYGLDHLTKNLELTKVRDYFLHYCKHPNFENATDSDTELEEWRKTIRALKDKWLTEKTMKAKDVLILSQTVRMFIDKFDMYYDIQPANCSSEIQTTKKDKKAKVMHVVAV